jgi:hypothetical protein
MIAKPLRVDNELRELIRKVKIERVNLGTDDVMKSDRRITKAIARLSVKDINFYNNLIKSPLDDDTKRRGRKLRLP